MGGNALKNIKTRRYKLNEYIETSNIIINCIKNTLNGCKISNIPHLKNKDTFGDLDILISYDNINTVHTISKTIINIFKPDEILKNGKCISFNFNDLQVDIIFTPIECFEHSLIYYSYNDAGLFIGRIARSIGLTYGSEYLRLKVYEGSTILCDINLCNDSEKIFKILDLDYNKFIKGFNDYYELFIFLSKSKLFCYNIFNSNLISSESRRRDNKRNSIHIFNEWLNNNKELFPLSTHKLNMEDIIKNIDFLFPEVKIIDIINKKREEICIKKMVSNKWNGEIIQKIFPNINGKLLGNSIIKFKKFIHDNGYDYNDYIIKFSIDHIISEFKKIL